MMKGAYNPETKERVQNFHSIVSEHLVERTGI